jgi:hypothetical protein
MPVRNRGGSDYVTNGIWQRFGQTYGGNSVEVYEHSCTDVIHEGMDNLAFDVSKKTFSGGVIHTSPQGSNYYNTYFRNYICEAVQYQGVFTPASSFPGELSKTAYATMTAARTNPSRPYVDVPVNVLELTEVAGLLRGAGNGIIKLIAANNLKYQFAIAPLVSDLFKLTQLQAQVDKRVQEIVRLQSQNGLRRTIPLANLSTSGVKNGIALQSQGCLISRNIPWSATRVIRGHSRWFPSSPVERLSQKEMSDLARKACLGLTLDFATAWERVPWSWLIDWCGTFGAYLMAHRNIIPAVLSSVNIMTHTRTQYSYPLSSTFDSPVRHYVSPLNVVLETKKRELVAVAPTAHFPFLSGNQMGILASLLAVKSKY